MYHGKPPMTPSIWMPTWFTWRKVRFKGRFNSYCWWLKSQTTTWDVWNLWNPINDGINYQPQPVSRISAINSRLSWAVLHVTFNHQVRFVDSWYTVIWFGYIQLFDVQVRFLFDVSYLYYIMTLVYLYYLSREPINLNIHDVFFLIWCLLVYNAWFFSQYSVSW